MGAQVVLASEVQNTLRHLPPQTKKALRATLKGLKKEWPSPRSLDVAALDTGGGHGPPAFRVRVGNWRIAFRATGDRLEVVRVFHRRDGYGWMERA